VGPAPAPSDGQAGIYHAGDRALTVGLVKGPPLENMAGLVEQNHLLTHLRLDTSRRYADILSPTKVDKRLSVDITRWEHQAWRGRNMMPERFVRFMICVCPLRPTTQI